MVAFELFNTMGPPSFHMGGGGRWLWVKKNDKENSENTEKKKKKAQKQSRKQISDEQRLVS